MERTEAEGGQEEVRGVGSEVRPGGDWSDGLGRGGGCC